MDVPPKLENLAADLAFKACYQGCCRYHDRHTERYRHRGNADDDAGEIFPSRKSDAAGNEKREIQGAVYKLRWMR